MQAYLLGEKCFFQLCGKGSNRRKKPIITLSILDNHPSLERNNIWKINDSTELNPFPLTNKGLYVICSLLDSSSDYQWETLTRMEQCNEVSVWFKLILPLANDKQ
ncbi:hypothetical protein TNCV_2449911 [Trichonephila clavipes]|uniref:Uncharacterized protein n=1 Tax=Trichonephila clavipes TaxID=2585209 RepID=A0A8X6REH0_TRICX|nr:hypothetical protein TNCV_2449911 [Trichonephila clavipes]